MKGRASPLFSCKLQKRLCLVCDDLLNSTTGEEARRGSLSYFAKGVARGPKHELLSVEEQFPERLIKRPEKRDQLLQLTVRTLAKKRRDFCVLSRLFVGKKPVPHVPIV